MRKYLVATLALCLLALGSAFYKQGRENTFAGFSKSPGPTGEPTLYLYGFFSSESCAPCGELIGVLNQLPGEFRITGVVPRAEAPRIDRLREEYQIRFPVQSAASFMRYRPFVSPSVIGATRGGKILFVLPCATLRADEITAFLAGIHQKLAPYLADPSF